MNPEYWTTVGIKEAQQRYGGGVSEIELVNQYREIQSRPIGEIKPYVAPEKVVSIPEYVAPATKVVGVLTGIVLLGKIFVVGISAIFAWMEANQIYAVGAVLMVGAVAAFGAGIGKVSAGNNPGKPDSSTAGGNTYINNHYYQQGSGGQTNGK